MTLDNLNVSVYEPHTTPPTPPPPTYTHSPIFTHEWTLLRAVDITKAWHFSPEILPGSALLWKDIVVVVAFQLAEGMCDASLGCSLMTRPKQTRKVLCCVFLAVFPAIALSSSSQSYRPFCRVNLCKWGAYISVGCVGRCEVSRVSTVVRSCGFGQRFYGLRYWNEWTVCGVRAVKTIALCGIEFDKWTLLFRVLCN